MARASFRMYSVGPAAIRSRAFLHSGSIKLKRVRKPIENQ
jgi:hypothetical protein